MRVCDICGATLNHIDRKNHWVAHLSEEEKDELARQMREEKEKNPKPSLSEEEIFRGFTDET